MKTSITILLCLVLSVKSMFPTIGLSTFFQLPELWSHYQVHRAEDARITFLKFLHLHYDGNSKHFSEDAKNHHKLPFSKARHGIFSFQALSDDLRTSERHPVYKLLTEIHEVSYVEIPAFLLVTSFWQPPRV